MIEQAYDFYLADTDAGKSIHFGLRYQVYCLRERYEDPAHHPNFLEQDEYDDRAVHFIARCRATGEWLGAMRLIIGGLNDLPVTAFSSLPDTSVSADWRRVAEASRLCTLLPNSPRAEFASGASRPGAHLKRNGASRTANSMQASWISLGLIRAARQYCLKHEITFCFFLISDPLARILRRLGLGIDAVGSPCQHRGWRSPYVHNVKTGYQTMAERAPELYTTFCQHNAYELFSRGLEERGEARLAAIA